MMHNLVLMERVKGELVIKLTTPVSQLCWTPNPLRLERWTQLLSLYLFSGNLITNVDRSAILLPEHMHARTHALTHTHTHTHTPTR